MNKIIENEKAACKSKVDTDVCAILSSNTLFAKAGWATCDITPHVGILLGGAGPIERLADKVLDPLLAGVVILEDGLGKRQIWVSLDLVSLNLRQAERICFSLASAIGVTPDDVLVNVSHTHSGPMMEMNDYATMKTITSDLVVYEEELVSRLTHTSLVALAKLQPVRVFWREGTSDIGINRRLPTKNGIEMLPNPQGIYNQQLWVLDIISVKDKEDRCIIFSYGCHPVVMYGFDFTAISSDWPGKCRTALAERLGAKTHFQFFQGLAGNVRPRILADLENNTFRKSNADDASIAGEQIAEDVLKTLNQPCDEINLDLAARREWFTVRQQPAEPAKYWQAMLESGNDTKMKLGQYWLNRLQMAEVPPLKSWPWVIGMIRLSKNYTIVYLGGEPVAEWKNIIEKCLPELRLVIFGYAHVSCGYLPIDEMLSEGGYEVTSGMWYKSGPGPFMPGLNAAVQTKVVRIFEQIL